LLQSFLPHNSNSVKQNLIDFMGKEADAEVIDMVAWLGFFDNVKIELEHGTPAQLLQNLLEKKWLLKPHDKDLVVMQHQFEIDNSKNPKLPKKIISSLVVTGTDQNHTAMAKTVGLPLGVCVKNFLAGKFNLSGVQIPIHKEIYEPMLHELAQNGIVFKETFIS